MTRHLIIGPNRSQEYADGHRAATRACVAWLHERADEMNDPATKALLNSAATNLGWEAEANKHRYPRPQRAPVVTDVRLARAVIAALDLLSPGWAIASPEGRAERQRVVAQALRRALTEEDDCAT